MTSYDLWKTSEPYDAEGEAFDIWLTDHSYDEIVDSAVLHDILYELHMGDSKLAYSMLNEAVNNAWIDYVHKTKQD